MNTKGYSEHIAGLGHLELVEEETLENGDLGLRFVFRAEDGRDGNGAVRVGPVASYADIPEGLKSEIIGDAKYRFARLLAKAE